MTVPAFGGKSADQDDDTAARLRPAILSIFSDLIVVVIRHELVKAQGADGSIVR
ncbi:MAG: hypothetical protein ACE5JX_21280 [Acidobacteriota bacterium]